MEDITVGFDVSIDTDVVVLARTDGGPWRVVDHPDREPDRLAGAVALAARFDALLPHPVAVRPNLLRNEIARWFPRHAAGPFHVDETQQQMAAELFARLLDEQKLDLPGTPSLAAHIRTEPTP